MPKIEADGLPVIEAAESETITVAVSADDAQAGDTKNPERHPKARAELKLESGPSKSWIKVKNPKAPTAMRAIDGTF